MIGPESHYLSRGKMNKIRNQNLQGDMLIRLRDKILYLNKKRLTIDPG